MTALLLLIFAGRVFRLDVTVTEMRVDEYWSIWQTFGSPQQILNWTAYDEPPLYYFVLGAWRLWVGLHPIVLRLLPILFFMLGSAFLYRWMRHIRSHAAGVLVVLAYGVLGYGIFLGTELRPYSLLLGVLPLALWLTTCYFERPRVGRAVALGVCLAGMFYVTLTAIGAFAVIGLYTLFAYPRRVWRWLLPGGVALLLALPELLSKANLAVSRTGGTSQIRVPPLPEAIAGMYRSYAGVGFLLLVALFAIAAMLIARHWRRTSIALLLWVAMPLALYALNPVLGFFQARYSWWVMLGLALWLGWGLSYLPSIPRGGAAVVLALLLFAPLPLDDYQIPGPPLGQTFVWLKERVQGGDVFVIDPNCGECNNLEKLDYLTRVYFPQGLDVVTNPTGYRRVWYMHGAKPDQALAQVVRQGRVTGPFYGPADLLIQLYQGPPDPVGIVFANGMRYHGAELLDATEPLALHEGDSVHLRLWWSADRPVDHDYSVSLRLSRKLGGTPLDQSDNAPMIQNGPSETSQWVPGQLYVEDRVVSLPYPASGGAYQVWAIVYFYQQPTPVPAPGVAADGLLPIRSLYVKAW